MNPDRWPVEDDEIRAMLARRSGRADADGLLGDVRRAVAEEPQKRGLALGVARLGRSRPTGLGALTGIAAVLVVVLAIGLPLAFRGPATSPATTEPITTPSGLLPSASAPAPTASARAQVASVMPVTVDQLNAAMATSNYGLSGMVVVQGRLERDPSDHRPCPSTSETCPRVILAGSDPILEVGRDLRWPTSGPWDPSKQPLSGILAIDLRPAGKLATFVGTVALAANGEAWHPSQLPDAPTSVNPNTLFLVDGWITGTTVEPCPSVKGPNQCGPSAWLADTAVQPVHLTPGGGATYGAPPHSLTVQIAAYEQFAPDPQFDGVQPVPRRATFLLERDPVGCPAGLACLPQLGPAWTIFARLDRLVAVPAQPQPSQSPDQPANVVEHAGAIASGGFWAIQGSTLFMTTDDGLGWRRSSVPGSTAFVLDTDHAWSVSPGPGSTGFSGAATDVLNLIVHQTTDEGATWQDATVPGNYPGTSQTLVFVDADHGFLLCAAQRHGDGVTTILATTDGGKTWKRAGHVNWLGSMFTATTVTTLWAGAQQEAGPVSHPLLDLSRDGGRTWMTAHLLPGIASGGGDVYLPGPPVFLDGDNGYVTVVQYGGDGQTTTTLFRTADSGHSWLPLGTWTSREATSGPVIANADTVYLPLSYPFGLVRSDDAGATWTNVASVGLPAGMPIEWLAFADRTHGAAMVPLTGDGATVGLYLTADGGRNWQPANLAAP